MIGLHKIVDGIKSGHFHYREYTNMNLDKLWSCMDSAIKVANKAQCFLIGDYMGVSNYEIIFELVRLPYENCYFEFTAGGLNFGVLCQRVTDNKFLYYEFIQVIDKGAKWAFANLEHVTIEKNNFIMTSDDRDNRQRNNIAVYAIAKFLNALYRVKADLQKTEVPKKLNAKKKKKGKCELYEFWELPVDLNKAKRIKSPPGGGTHASPGLHFRMAHWRRLKSGKRIRVNECTVGDEERIIMKDYITKKPSENRDDKDDKDDS